MATLYTGTITGVAGSLITLLDTILVTGQGWTKYFSATNKAMYRQVAGGQNFVRIDDNAPATAAEARVNVFESVTDIDTGVGIPSTGYQYIRKSHTADATARNYKCVADGQGFVLFIEDAAGTSGIWQGYWVGDCISYKSADAYATMLACRTTENSTSVTIGAFHVLTSSFNGLTNKLILRSVSGINSAPTCGWMTLAGGTGFGSSANLLPYPDLASGKFVSSSLQVVENSEDQCLRGSLPWLRDPLHQVSVYAGGSLNSGDTVTIDGVSYVLLNINGTSYYVLLQTSGL